MTRPLSPALLIIAALTCIACGRPETDEADPVALMGGNGGSALRLTLQDSGGSAPFRDARGGQLQEAKAVVHAVSAHVAGQGWLPLMEGRVEVDFLNLSASAAELGIASLPPGKITQVRLYVLDDEAAYVVDSAGVRHPLLTPSGSESGIKLKGKWEVGPCERATLALSTRASKAIHIHGRGADDSYVLRPVIRVDNVTTAPIEGCSAGVPDDGAPGDDDDDDAEEEVEDGNPGSSDDEPVDFNPEGGGPGVELDGDADNDDGDDDCDDDGDDDGDDDDGDHDRDDDEGDSGLGVTSGGGLGESNDDPSTDSRDGGVNDAADDGDDSAGDGADDAGLCYNPESSAFFPCT